MLFQHVKQWTCTHVNWNRLEQRSATKKEMHTITKITRGAVAPFEYPPEMHKCHVQN